MSIKLSAVMDALWGGCVGLIEFRALPPPAQKFAALTEKKHLGAFLRVHVEQHCHWGVATRCDDSSGKAENCRHLPAIYSDLDFAKTSEAEARQALAQIPLPPSLVVHSGHGLHPYWFLHEPFDLQVPRECTEAHTLLARLAVCCASDPAVVDVARVLRVPTTFNYKYDPPRLVQIEAFHAARRYDPLEFDGWLPPPPADATVIKPFKVPAVVEPGNRNDTLFRLGRSLKAKGLAPDVVSVALHAVNGQIPEPLRADEVAQINDSVHRRRNRPTFGSSAASADVADTAPEPAAKPAPAAPPPAQALADLLDAVVVYLRTFVVMSASAQHAVALWVLHTHAIDAAEHTPYLHVTSGTKRAGKTLLLDVLEQVVRRPWLTQRTTTAALVRKLDKEHPTLLLDELDQALKAGDDYAATLTQTLNAGFKRGGVVSICRGEGAAMQVVDLAVFGPKVLSGIGHLPDTVADRSIAITLRRKTRDEQVARARARAIRSAAAPLRAPLEQWGIAATSQVKGAEHDVPDALDDRQQDIWDPLLALADLAGQHWPDRARTAALLLTGERSDDDIAVALLRDIAELIAVPDTPVVMDDIVSSRRLLKRLVRLPERPWATWTRGREMSARAMADLLRRLDLHSAQFWVEAVDVRGYRVAEIKASCVRYRVLPPSDPTTRGNANNDGPELPFSTRETAQPADASKTPVSPYKTGLSHGSSDEAPPGAGGSEKAAEPTEPLPGSVTEPAAPDNSDPIGAHDEDEPPLRCCLDGGPLWARCRGCTAVDAAIRDRVHAAAPDTVRTPKRSLPPGQKKKGGPTPLQTGAWGRPS